MDQYQDDQSVAGQFEGGMPDVAGSSGPPVGHAVRGGTGMATGGVAPEGVVRGALPVRRAVGRGPVPVDPRKFKYDRTRGGTMPQLSFGASKADRLDAEVAGEILNRIHELVGIAGEPENVLVAFDKALFFEHTINGASLLQPGRGVLTVGDSQFELQTVKTVLGVDQRRFFRAFADDIAEVNKAVIDEYDPYDPGAVDKYGQLAQVAVERGLQKYPYLAHDSSDAGVRLSVEERLALMQSKRLVLDSTVNNADKLGARPRAYDARE